MKMSANISTKEITNFAVPRSFLPELQISFFLHGKWSRAIQLQEYQTDMGRCRFDTPGKLTPAHRAGAPPARGRWVAPPRWVSASATAAGPPTVQGQGSISLEYQTCTSPYPFDTLVTGLSDTAPAFTTFEQGEVYYNNVLQS